VDRHKIWRIVRNNLDFLKSIAPDGYEPVVDVYVYGRPEPVRLNHVETSREEDFDWMLLTGGEAPAAKDAHHVFVHEAGIDRIEITFAPSEDRAVGFSHRDLDERDVGEESA
jgi:hypothetical protein